MGKYDVLIDLGRLKSIHTGLGQVALLFGKAISKLNDEQLRFTFLVPSKFKGKFGDSIDYEIVSLKRRYFPEYCKRFDLWHAIHQDSAHFPGDRAIPYLLTIHDLNFLDEKGKSKARTRLELLQRKVDRAAGIIAISRFTKDVIAQNLRLDEKIVEVIYNGVEQNADVAIRKPAFVPEGKFVFAISVVKQKKNFKVLVDFINDLNDYKLIIAGNKSDRYAKELEQDVLSKGLENRIILPGEISEEDKYWLYQNCEALVFPSMYEGFGLPVIEAMNFGKPVFLSTYSSLPEIGDKHAFYWENFNSQYMSDFFRQNMLKFSQDPEKQVEMKQYAHQFTWEKNVAEYIQLYKKILNI